MRRTAETASSRILRILAFAAMSAGTLVIAPAARAQQSTQQQNPPSVADIARQTRAAQQQSPTKAKVYTNDTIPKSSKGVSVVGQPAPAPVAPADAKAASDAAAKTGEVAGAAPAKPKTLAELEADLAQAQKDLDLQSKELDLAKRDFVLQQQAFYTNPMANQDQAGQAQLAEAQKQIDAMQAEVDKATAHIAELQAKLDEMKKTAPATPTAENPGGSGSGN